MYADVVFRAGARPVALSPPCPPARSSTTERAKSCWSPRAMAASSRGRSSSAVAATAMSRSSRASTPGEEIVTTATFLIDAESNLQSGARRPSPSRNSRNDCGCHPLVGAQPLLVGFAGVFLTLAGLYAVSRVPLDAIPDLSDVQVIVYTEYPGQAPQVVEDQVTYPLTTAMLSVPKSKVVRGFSFFGVSFVYVIFEDGTDLYWARSRVLEYLNSAARRLPAGVAPSLGPDATGVGWVYQYVVRGAQKNLAELRSHSGLVHPLRPRQGGGRRRGRQRRRLRQAVQRGDRSAPAAVARHPAVENSRCNSLEQYRRRRPHRRTGGDRIRRARPRLHQESRPISSRSSSRATKASRYCCATSRASSWRRTSAAASPR